MAELHVHTLSVKHHHITCDSPVLVQHGMGHDAVALDLDAEYDGLADLLHRIDVLYAGGRLTDEERENLCELARTKANPDDSLPDVTERVGALELRVAALEQGTYQPSEPEVDPEWPDWVRPTSKDEYYHKGDKVTFEGVRYVCNKNNVVASPAENPKSWIRQD